MSQFLYRKESYDILGAAMDVYNELGSGFLEAIYHDALEIELGIRNITYESQKPLVVYYRGHRLAHQYQADMICYGRILLELKAVKDIHDVHLSQVLNYLKATDLALGYVINFGSPENLQWQRVVLSENMNEDELGMGS